MKQWSFLAIALLAVLAACGGGGGGTSAPVVPQNAATSPAANATAGAAGTLKATLSLTVPNAVTGQGVRRAQTVASGTQSITLTLLQTNGVATSGTVQGPFALTASSPGCATGANGVTCTFQIDAPIGDDIFVAQTYSTTTAAANTKLGSGAVAMTIKQNAQNTSTLTLNGPVASVVLTSAGSIILGNLPYPSSQRVFTVALDSSNNVIVNPSTFDQPVHLRLNYTGGTSLIALTVAYAYPNGGAASATTSASGGVVDTTSPSDTITVSVIAGQSGSQSATVTALVGTTAQTPALSVSAFVNGPSPTPSPPGTPCPAYDGGSPPLCSAPALTLGPQGTDGRISPRDSLAQFLTLTDPQLLMQVTPSSGTPPYSGTVTFSDGGTCAALGLTVTSSGSPYAFNTPVSATGGNYKLEASLPTGSSPPPLSSGAKCTVTATEDGVPNASTTFSISANHITGTIQ